ncbi:MAG: aminotransferase class V-fold PLP-dependent enzyme [Gemmataceae bacterium]
MQTDWTAARAAMMLDPTVINLNSGSFGPTPRPVFERVTELRRHLAAEPMDFLVRQLPPLLWRARERLAAFLGSSPEHLVFRDNVTAAINLVASSLRIESPGEILMSDREYGAMQWCWERAAARQGLSVRYFKLPLMPASPDEIVASVERAITPKTRLLFFSHVYSATGLIVPAKELCSLARRRGIVSVVDGAHAVAMIDLNLTNIGADYYGGNCHKWLFAPIGSGFLVASAEALDRLEPFQVSWGYRDRRSDERDEYGSTPRVRRLEFEATRDTCAWLAVPDAIDFQTSLGWEAIRDRVAQLAAYTRDHISELELTTPIDAMLHGAMTTFWWPTGFEAADLRRRLWDRKIEAIIGEWPEGLTLRVSTPFFTTEPEIDSLAGFVRDTLAQ